MAVRTVKPGMKDRMALANDLTGGGEEVLPAEFWKPVNVGDTICGVVQRVETRRSDYGDGKQLVALVGPCIVKDAKGTNVFAEIAVNVDLNVLHGLRSPSAIGGVFAVQYLGEEKSRKGPNSYKDFLVTRQTEAKFRELMKKYGATDDDLPF